MTNCEGKASQLAKIKSLVADGKDRDAVLASFVQVASLEPAPKRRYMSSRPSMVAIADDPPTSGQWRWQPA